MTNRKIISGIRLKELRIQEAMSVAELAVKAEISKDTIYDLESGLSMPSVFVCQKLATALDCRRNELLDWWYGPEDGRV